MRGWKITIAITLGLLVLTGLQLAIWGSDEEGIRVVVRSTARSSVLLFVLAFGASSLRTLWRKPASAWLLANRRYVGVSYAASHILHAVALVGLAGVSAKFVEGLGAVTLVGGGVAYGFTVAMAATSNDAAVAALGRPRWRLLHLIGGWYIWGIFAQSYLPRAIEMPSYWPAGVLVLAIPGLRIARRLRSGNRAKAAQQQPGTA